MWTSTYLYRWTDGDKFVPSNYHILFPMHQIIHKNMGKYRKEQVNENGNCLLETALKYNLVLTNTLLKHKLCHRSTWNVQKGIIWIKAGTWRRNPYKNQIDHIMINKQFRRFVTNSRSYGGIKTSTDHKLVTAETNFNSTKWNQRLSRKQLLSTGSKIWNTEEDKVNHKLNEEGKEDGDDESLQDKWYKIKKNRV